MTTQTRPQTRPRLLCIDDDPAIPEAITRHLARYNLDVLAAFFGTQGIWLAATEKPDVVITDMRMPQGEGSYVVECLKHRVDTSEIPLIVLTGKRDPQLELRMRGLGVFHYLHKPLKFDVLLGALGEFINLEPAQTAQAECLHAGKS